MKRKAAPKTESTIAVTPKKDVHKKAAKVPKIGKGKAVKGQETKDVRGTRYIVVRLLHTQ